MLTPARRHRIMNPAPIQNESRTLQSEPNIPATSNPVADLTTAKIDEINLELSALADLAMQQRVADNIEELIRDVSV